jgi:hypothetical protein
MLIFTNYLGGTDNLVVCLGQANWATNPALTGEFPFADISRALLGNEDRRPFGLTKKHGSEYSPIFLNEFDSTAFRQGLNRLKNEQVAVPLWTDVCLTTGALTTTGTSLTIDQQPARYGAHWILVAPDNFTFEIVEVTLLSGTTLTLAARTGSAWAAGAKIYPILFGKFNPRPTLESITPSTVKGGLQFIEDSAITEKIIPVPSTMSIQVVGSHIPDFSTSKLWTLQPVSEPTWMDTSDADILYAQLGLGRQEQSYPQQSWNRRGLEMEFYCRSRDEIRYVESFFSGRLGPCRSFFIPTFRNDLKLAANITSGATTFPIAESRYEDAAYDDPPGNAFLALVDPTGVYPQRITAVDGLTHTITPQVAVGENHTAATTRISFLMLCRFATTKLEWNYITPSRARIKIQFLELPDEYVDPQPDEPTEAYLFDFEESLPNGTTNRWRFTNYEDQIVFSSNTYLIGPYNMSERDVGLSIDDSCDLNSWGLFAGNPLNRFLPYTLNASLILTITRVTATAPDDGNARVLFVGKVVSISTKGAEWTAHLRDPVARAMDLQYPKWLFQTQDNAASPLLPPTTLDPADFAEAGTISALSVGGNEMMITVSGPTDATDWFSQGWCIIGTGATAEVRFIQKSTLASGIQTFTIDRPLVFAIVGTGVVAYLGYDGSREMRDTKFGDPDGFLGHPFIPDTSPNTDTSDIKTPSVAKK